MSLNWPNVSSRKTRHVKKDFYRRMQCFMTPVGAVMRQSGFKPLVKAIEEEETAGTGSGVAWGHASNT